MVDIVKRSLLSGVALVAAALILPVVTHHGAVTTTPATSTQIPTVDYTTDSAGIVAPDDAEYRQYRNVVPQSDPLGPVIPAPPDGSSPGVWRAFGVAQCERFRNEPAWYRRGAGCHVSDDPATPHMVFDLPPTERADLDREQQNRISKVCDAANRFGYECNVIATDGP